MKDVPCVVFAFVDGAGGAGSVIPACQNLMLAAHALGIGSPPTTLHATVMDRFHAMFGIPRDVTLHFCIPLGYPARTYGTEPAQAYRRDDLPDPVGEPRCPKRDGPEAASPVAVAGQAHRGPGGG